MLPSVLPVNTYLLAGLILAAAFLGFVFRRRQIRKLKKRVSELEKDLLSDHADILEFQKEKKILEQKLKEFSTTPVPVIPLSSISGDETKSDKLQDTVIRKKLHS